MLNKSRGGRKRGHIEAIESAAERACTPDYGPTQLVAGIEVLANHCQDGVEPNVINYLLAVLLRNAAQTNHPPTLQ
jgi:hypothetical protein